MDDKFNYSACWKRKEWTTWYESGYEGEDYRSLIIYETDGKLKAVICFDDITPIDDKEEE